MKRSSIPLIVSSCDKCSDLWQPFFTLVKKNWPDFDRKVYLCTDSMTFAYEGFDITCPLRMSSGSTWTENLMALLKGIDEEYVLLMLEDFWLKEMVDEAQLYQCEEIIKNDPTIGFICLVHQLDPSPDNPSSEIYPNLIEYGQRTAYRVTTQAGLWRRDYLLSLLRKHESAWWFEMFGSKRSRRSACRSYVVKKSVFSYDDGGVLFRGSFVEEYIRFFMDDKNITINPKRRIDIKVNLLAEVKERTILQKLNPSFVYHYCLSHF